MDTFLNKIMLWGKIRYIGVNLGAMGGGVDMRRVVEIKEKGSEWCMCVVCLEVYIGEAVN